MRTTIEQVMRALNAANDKSITPRQKTILKGVGGTTFRNGQFELALTMDEVARKLKEPPGIVRRRVHFGTATAKAAFDGHTIKHEEDLPLPESPIRLLGALHIGSRGKVKHQKAR